MALLELRRLSLTLPDGLGGRLGLLEEVDLQLEKGLCEALVGESGCGKSMTALAVMGLTPAAASLSGQILFAGRDLLRLDEAAYRRLRGRRLAMVFQEPMTALNPVKSIGAQVAEGLRWHLGLNRHEAERRALGTLERVGLAAASYPPTLYPHQLSGGQRQRVVIAIALACEPDLLIADEPTTALDVIVQRQIIRLLLGLIEQTGMGLLLITHDLGLVAASADRVNVMYAGRMVERGDVASVFERPRHPYTRGLLEAMPRIDETPPRLQTIPGGVPPPGQRPPGCVFAERCSRARPDCRAARPELGTAARAAACFHPLTGNGF